MSQLPKNLSELNPEDYSISDAAPSSMPKNLSGLNPEDYTVGGAAPEQPGMLETAATHAAASIPGVKTITSALAGIGDAASEWRMPTMDDYRRNRDAINRDLDASHKTNPWTAGVAGLGGTIGSTVLAGGLPLVKAIGPAAELAIYNADQSRADLTKNDPAEYNKFIKDIVIGQVLGKVVGEGTQLLGSAGRHLLPAAAKGALTKMSSAILPYIERHPEMKNVPEAAAIREEVLAAQAERRAAAEAAEKGVQSAESAEAARGQNLVSDLNSQAASQEAEALQARQTAQEVLQQQRQALAAKEAEAVALQQEARAEQQQIKDHLARQVKNSDPAVLTEDVVNAHENLANNVTEASSKAREHLVEGNSKVPFRVLHEKLAAIENGLKQGPGKVLQPETEAAVNEIRDHLLHLEHGPTLPEELGQLDQTTSHLSGNDAKNFLQWLDRRVKYAEFSGAAKEAVDDRVLKQFRHEVDSYLKDVNPDYRAAMDKVAPLADALGRSQRLFKGDERRIQQTLRRLAEGNALPHDLETLSLLQQHTDRDIVKELSDRRALLEQAKQRVHPSPSGLDQRLAQTQQELEALRAAATQAQEQAVAAAKEHQAVLSDSRNLRNRQYQQHEIQRTASEAPEARQLLQARLKQQGAQAKLASFEGITEANLESRLRRAAQKNAIDKGDVHLRNQLEAIGQETGKPLLRQVDNRQILDALQRPTTNGSRRAVIMGSAGAAIGGAVGLPKVGAAVGTAIGGSIDKAGGMLAKGLVDTGFAAKDAAQKGVSLVAETLGTTPERLGQYAGVLQNAASRGSAAFAAAHFTLGTKDPAYQKLMSDLETEKRK